MPRSPNNSEAERHAKYRAKYHTKIYNVLCNMSVGCQDEWDDCYSSETTIDVEHTMELCEINNVPWPKIKFPTTGTMSFKKLKRIMKRFSRAQKNDKNATCSIHPYFEMYWYKYKICVSIYKEEEEEEERKSLY